MVYECDQCSKALPPGVSACPSCGEKFDDAVPSDAEVPKRGFSAAASSPAQTISTPEISAPPEQSHGGAYPLLDAPAGVPQSPFPSPAPSFQGPIYAPAAKPNGGVSIWRVLLILFLFFGGGSAYIMSTMNSIEHGSLSGANPASTFSASHSVTYKVTGNTPSASLTFNNAGGDSQQISNAALPWSQTFTMSSGAFMYISAQNNHDAGDIQVEIDVDGTARKQSQSQGAYAVADTSDPL